MANDVGIRIGVDGERQFRSALQAINAQARALNSEMRSVVSSFAGMEDSEESAAARADVLNRAISTQNQRLQLLGRQADAAQSDLERLGRELDIATRQFGENSRQAARAQNAYNNQVRTVAELNRQMSDGRADLSRYQRELDNIGRAADDAGDELQDAGRQASNFGDTLKAAIIGGGISGLVQSLAGSISGLAETTVEYNRIMGSLKVSSEQAGYTAEETAESYKQLYAVLGDEQTAATTVANLQALGLEQEQLIRLTDGAIGAWATYGDSIPIDGLAEAINETIRVGQVTGTFADVLNWAGTSEDDFNLLLEGTKTEAERVQLVLDELTKQNLPEAAQAWRDANAELIAYQEANANLQSTMGEIGTLFMPMVTATKTAVNDVLQGILQLYNDSGIGDALREQGIGAITSFAQGIIANIPAMLTSARTAIQSFSQGLQQQSPAIIAKGGELVTKLVGGIIDNLPDIVGAAVDIVTGLARTILANLPAIAKTGVELIKAIIGGLFQALPDLLQGAIDIIVDVAEVLLHEIPISIYNVGAEIVKGLYQGVLDSWEWLKNNLKDWAGNITSTIKGALGIHSPSTVTRDEIGKPITQGVAQGMQAAAPKIYSTADEINRKALYRMQMIEARYKQTGSDAVSDMAEGMQAAEPTALAVAQELNNRLLEKQDELKEALKAKKLDEATKESLNKQLDAVKTFQSEYQAALDDIVKSQESMATRLQAYGELFTRVTDEKSGKELINVEDLQEQISKLDEFNQVLINLENRQIPEGLLDNIAQMDVDDAIAYGTELLKMSSSQFDSYITLWTQKQQKAQQIAERYYQGELTALKSEYLDKIPAELSNLKGQIDGMGKEVGKAITESIGQGAGNAAIAIGQMQSEDTTEADVFTKTVEGLRSQQQILIDYLIQLMKLSLSTIRDFLGDFQNAGQQLMNGLGQGILDGRSAVIEAIRSTLEDIVEQAKRSLQINSPSKVFAEIGDYTAQGFGVGFTDRMADVTKDVAAAMPYSIGDNRAVNSQTSNDNRIYNGGDIILNIERVDNGNSRNIEDLAQELEFYRRQQTTAIGGAW